MNHPFSKPGKVISLMLTAALCNMMLGCTFYELRQHPASDLAKAPNGRSREDRQYPPAAASVDASNRSLVVHYKKHELTLNHVAMDSTELTGSVHYVYPESKDPDNSIHDDGQALVAHLYVDTLDSPVVAAGTVLHIPLSSLRRVMLYDVNLGATVMTYVGITAGACAIIAAVVAIVALLTKQSCPFIYAYNGSTYHFYGEIYSGAIYRSLERHDYLALPSIAETTGTYSVRITNEVREIQHTNLMELLVVDHPAGSMVLLDQAGTPHTITDPKAALRCSTASGTDAGSLLASPDSLTYLTDVLHHSQIMDSLMLTFKRPAGSAQAKLVVRAKNSFWLDYVVGEFLDLFGNKLDKWNESRARGSKEEILKWMQEQGFPLAISVDEGTGFRPVECLPEAGPMAFRDYVIPLSLGTTSADSIRIKLAFGAMFWEVDYAAIDFSPDAPITISTVGATAAMDEKGNDVLASIVRDDQRYYDQPEIGNKAAISFPAKAKRVDSNRTVFLHSKGYYQILRPPRKAAPDVAYLQRFKKPGGFIQFANDRLRTIYEDAVK